ncbi:hypothetical protein AKJ16_DCAP22978, partial [Drosera capensis]
MVRSLSMPGWSLLVYALQENFKWDPENPQAVFNEFRRK